MRFTDWRKQNVAPLIHSISHNEVNVKMQTGGPLLAGITWPENKATGLENMRSNYGILIEIQHG